MAKNALVHQIILDQARLEEFVSWLPELKPHEKYFLCLQARKKYMPSLKSNDKTQLKRFTSSKETLVDKIMQLECPIGCYRTKEGEIITDEAIALYITLNPRDMLKATYMSAKALIDTIQKQEGHLNPHSEVLSCIHKSKGKSNFVHFDIDKQTGNEQDKNAPKTDLSIANIFEIASKIVGKEAVTIIETRGGCHLLIDPSKVGPENKNWYPMITKQIQCDQSGDLMVPVVGCCQGGFIPRFYEV